MKWSSLPEPPPLAFPRSRMPLMTPAGQTPGAVLLLAPLQKSCRSHIKRRLKSSGRCLRDRTGRYRVPSAKLARRTVKYRVDHCWPSRIPPVSLFLSDFNLICPSGKTITVKFSDLNLKKPNIYAAHPVAQIKMTGTDIKSGLGPRIAATRARPQSTLAAIATSLLRTTPSVNGRLCVIR